MENKGIKSVLQIEKATKNSEKTPFSLLQAIQGYFLV